MNNCVTFEKICFHNNFLLMHQHQIVKQLVRWLTVITYFNRVVTTVGFVQKGMQVYQVLTVTRLTTVRLDNTPVHSMLHVFTLDQGNIPVRFVLCWVRTLYFEQRKISAGCDNLSMLPLFTWDQGNIPTLILTWRKRLIWMNYLNHVTFI